MNVSDYTPAELLEACFPTWRDTPQTFNYPSHFQVDYQFPSQGDNIGPKLPAAEVLTVLLAHDLINLYEMTPGFTAYLAMRKGQEMPLKRILVWPH